MFVVFFFGFFFLALILGKVYSYSCWRGLLILGARLGHFQPEVPGRRVPAEVLHNGTATNVSVGSPSTFVKLGCWIFTGLLMHEVSP